MFPAVLLSYLILGMGMAAVWSRAEPGAPLVIAAGILSSLCLALPLAKRLPGSRFLYFWSTDKDREFRAGGFDKPFIGPHTLEAHWHEGAWILRRTGLYDSLAFLAWVFVLSAVLFQHGGLPLLRFWRNLLLWLPALFT